MPWHARPPYVGQRFKCEKILFGALVDCNRSEARLVKKEKLWPRRSWSTRWALSQLEATQGKRAQSLAFSGTDLNERHDSCKTPSTTSNKEHSNKSAGQYPSASASKSIEGIEAGIDAETLDERNQLAYDEEYPDDLPHEIKQATSKPSDVEHAETGGAVDKAPVEAAPDLPHVPKRLAKDGIALS